VTEQDAVRLLKLFAERHPIGRRRRFQILVEKRDVGKVVTFSFSVSGASLASALAILSVKLCLRRLPTIVTMLYGAAMGGDPLLKTKPVALH